MDTYSLKPGESFTIHRKRDFYSDASMISLKATSLSFPEREMGKKYKFKIAYIHSNGKASSFHLVLEAPYFMAAGRLDSSSLPFGSAGPFNMVTVESENDIPIVLQVSFTDKLVAQPA